MSHPAPFTADDHRHMARALQLARQGLGNTDPNPTVGCVLVRDAAIVGAGWTAPAGGPHAERVALREAGARARGATAYVTLEPCCHTGRTGPCTEALLAAGVRRVIYALEDPNPAVAGRGAATLQAAGLDVAGGLMAAPAAELNAGFLKRMRTARPYVRLKMAASLDGRTALANGFSQWLTGTAAREDVHRWRARSSVVLTGSGTVLADDPGLDARPQAPGQPFQQPARVVIDTRGRVPGTAKLFTLPGDTGVITAAAAVAAAEQAGWVASVPSAAGGCDLAAALLSLGARGYNDAWVEAGSRLGGGLLAAGLVDELIVYLAPAVLGSSGRGMFELPVFERLDERLGFELIEMRQFAPDLRLRWRPRTVARDDGTP